MSSIVYFSKGVCNLTQAFLLVLLEQIDLAIHSFQEPLGIELTTRLEPSREGLRHSAALKLGGSARQRGNDVGHLRESPRT